MPLSAKTFVFSPKTCNALRKDSTVRLLLKAKLKAPHGTREAEPLLKWAQDQIDHVCTTFLDQMGYPDDKYDAKLILMLVENTTRFSLCFDILPTGGTEEARAQVQDMIGRPIHCLTKIRRVIFVQRDPEDDQKIARRLYHIRQCFKGPLPLFVDLQNVPKREFGPENLAVDENGEPVITGSPKQRSPSTVTGSTVA